MVKMKISHELYAKTLLAASKAFWFRDSLKGFLRRNGVSKGYLSTWQADESKAKFLSRLFGEMESQRGENITQSLLSMAKELSETKTFVDWEHRREDSSINVQEAKQACEELALEYTQYSPLLKEKEYIESRKRHESERAKELKQWEDQLGGFESEFKELMKRAGEQCAGYEFEQWIYRFSKFNDIEVVGSHKDHNGRQIDGAITIDGTTILVEAKCTGKPIKAADVDIFLSKVSRVAENTRGIIISMMGFENGAIKGASRDKTPLVLMDGMHFFSLVFSGRMLFPDVIRCLLRHASQTGDAYMPSVEF